MKSFAGEKKNALFIGMVLSIIRMPNLAELDGAEGLLVLGQAIGLGKRIK